MNKKEKLIFEEINELSVPHKLVYNVDLGEYENSVEYKVNQLIRNQKKIIEQLEIDNAFLKKCVDYYEKELNHK